MTLLRLNKVEASYGAVRALRGVSLAIEARSVVALLGANGAGKSTTLKCISGMVRPSAGTIEFEGRPLNGLSPNQIVGLGVAQVPEGRKIFKDLTVIENLRMGAYTRGDRAGIERDLDLVYTLFPRLKERSSQLGGSLSGGEQQMLAIGRGLMAEPRLLILDEPSLGLAPIVIDRILDVAAQLCRQGLSILLVEQLVDKALRHAHHGYLVETGRIAADAPAAELQQGDLLHRVFLGGHAAPVATEAPT